MKYLYSAKTNAFYPVSFEDSYVAAGTWPDDGIEVDDVLFLSFQNPPPGKIRISGSDGLPAWADIPPQSHADLVAQADAQKAAQRKIADSAIAPLQDAVDLGIATLEETAQLTEWKTYRLQLNRVDISTAPDIDWPEMPA